MHRRQVSPRRARAGRSIRSLVRRHLPVTLAATLAAPSLIYAQTVTNTWISPGPGLLNWSVPAHWFDNTPPAAGGSDTTVLQFNNMLDNSYTANNDLGNPFLIHGIVLNSTSSASATSINNAAGNSLEFRGTTPFVTQSNFGGFTITAPFTLNPTSGDFTINGSGLGNATLSGAISQLGGAREVVIDTTPSVLNAGVITLTGANSHTGGIRLVSGNLALSGPGAIGAAGSVLTVEGGTVQGTTTVNAGNPITLTSTMRIIGAQTMNFSGMISGPGGLTLSGTAGSPVVSLSGDNTYAGATTIDQAQVFTVNAPASPGHISITGGNGKIDSTLINVRSSASFNISNSTAAYTGGSGFGRIRDDATISVNGAFLSITSTSTVTASEMVGALNVDGGHNVLTLTPGTSAQANMTFTTVSRGSDRGILFVRGAGIGDVPASNKTNVYFGNAAALLVGGGGAAGSKNISIIPWVAGDRTPSTTGASTTAGSLGFMTNGVDGLRVLTGAEYAAGFAGITSSNDNLRLIASENPPGGGVTVNSILFQGTSTVGTAGSMDAISFGTASPDSAAAIIYNTNVVTMNSPLAFGGNEGKFFTISTLTANGVISGTNGITKAGTASTLVLAANNTFSGPLTINGGTVSFSSLANLGTGDEIIAGGGVLGAATFTGGARARLAYTGASALTVPHDIRLVSGLFEPRSSTATLTLGGTISGPGGLMINSTGNVVLAGNNTYTGPTRIFGGSVVITSDLNFGIGGAVDLGSVAGQGIILDGNWTTSRQVNLSATSQLNTQAFDAVLNGPVTGASALGKVGSGRLVLNGVNPYTGVMTISSGVLEVNGSLGPSTNAVTIAAGANLTGTGTLYRPVTMTGASTLSPGNSAGTLRMNSLTLQSGNTLLFDVGTSSDLVELGGGVGTVTLPTSGSYALRLGDTTGLAPGDFTLFTYGTRVNTLNPAVQNVPAGLKGSFNFGATSGVLTIAPLLEYEWAPAGADSDGDGAWTQGGGNWEIGTTPVNYTTTDDNANFGQGGTAGVVTLGNPVSVRRINFQPVSSGVYEISQGTGALNVLEGVEANNADGLISAGIVMTSSNTMTVGTGRTLDLNGVISGTGIGLTKEGPGLLRLGAANTYTGGTTVNQGILRLNAVGAYPANTPLTVNAGGAFELNGFDASVSTVAGTGNIVLGSTLTITGGAQSLDAHLSGPGSLAYAPTSVASLTINNTNAHQGGTTGSANARFRISNAAAFGTGPVTLNDSTNSFSAPAIGFVFPTGTSTTVGNAISLSTLGASSTTFAALTPGTSQTITLSGLISGGAATHNLDWDESGATNSNVLVLDNPGNTFVSTIRPRFGVIAFTSNGALGDPANVLDLTGGSASTASGIRFDANNITVPRNVSLGTTKGINTQVNSAILSGVISGTGSFAKLGAGELTLTGANTYSGSTTVSAGTLRVNGTHGTTAGAYTVAAGARLGGSGAVTLATNASVTINGAVAPGTSVGALSLTTSGTGSTVLAPGGSYEFEIDDAAGTAGASPGWDKLNVAALNVTATAGNKFTVKINALPGTGGPGLDNFDPLQSYTWTIASATSITGFDPGHFQIDSTGFENNNTNHGGFALSFSGGDVQLTYVPEPACGALLALGGFGLLRRRRVVTNMRMEDRR